MTIQLKPQYRKNLILLFNLKFRRFIVKCLIAEIALALFLCCTAHLFTTAVYGQKIAPEEIIAKHLDSIGTKEKRDAVKNQLIFTDVSLKRKGSTSSITGKGLILSAIDKNLWGMNFNSVDLPQDKFGFNGKNTKVGVSGAGGGRSIIGDFIYLYPELLSEGLLGGTLSVDWALSDIAVKKSRLTYEGTKTIGESETFVLSFSPRGGSDLSVKMYFDKKNYRHLRTEYNRVIAARPGNNVDGSAGQGEDRYRVVEDFSEYVRMGDLLLPSKYKLFYSYSSGAALRLQNKDNREFEWQFVVTNFSFNQQIDGKSFEISN